MLGCTNPKAVNYNPEATQEDYSCIYLEKHNNNCYAFKDVQPDRVVDKSFTLSYSFEGKDWVFFHDYIPDFYFSTRKQLYNLKDSRIYKHNSGAPGVYHTPEIKPFFIDAVFNSQEEETLNTVEWITEVLNQQQITEFSTLTHITIWNAVQCTGRIKLSDFFDNLEYKTHRQTKSVWSFNDFRDLVKDRGTEFLADIFNNFEVLPESIDYELPWYDQLRIEGNWVTIRFEFDNQSGKQIVLHQVDIDTSKSFR